MTDVLKVGLASGSSNHEEGRGKHIPSRPSQHPACFELFPLPISSSCLLCNESLSRPSLHQHPPCLLFAARHRTDAVSTVPNAYAHRRYSSPVPTANPATETRDYEAHHLLVLEGLEAVRKRPAMYIGSTDTRGLMHCLWESSTTPSTKPSAVSAKRFPSHCAPMALFRSLIVAAGSPSTSNRGPAFPEWRSCSPSSTRVASSATAATTPPGGCTASARRWSTPWRAAWTSRWIATAPPGRCRSDVVRPELSTAPGRMPDSPPAVCYGRLGGQRRG